MDQFRDSAARALTAQEELGPPIRPGLPSPYSAMEKPGSPPKVPPRTKILIGELFLRYRPATGVDPEAYAARMALMARDLADIPPVRLEQAINDWVRNNKWLPTAAELIELARSYVMRTAGNDTSLPLVDQYNARLAKDGRTGVRWVQDDQGMRLVPVDNGAGGNADAGDVDEAPADMLARLWPTMNQHETGRELRRPAKVSGGTGKAPRAPTRADYIAMGVDPSVLDQLDGDGVGHDADG